MEFDSGTIVPVGYADIGLLPLAVRHGDRLFIGIDELLVSYHCSDQSVCFIYKMPTVFHEFVRFDQNGLIVRDEIGFVGISYNGDESWSFCKDLIACYEIDQATILGKTEEGENFKFIIPPARP